MDQAEQVENSQTAQTEASAGAESQREVSTIQFPYGDLDDAVEIAKHVFGISGPSCEATQLADVLRINVQGGGFRARLSPPRIFGLIETEKGQIRLTPLGMRVADPQQEEAARAEAFLAVPLYRAIYESYKGSTLPGAAALERQMAGMGVSSKQTDKARQVFERSARQAGFFWAAQDRLTMPANRPITPIVNPPAKPEDKGKNGNGGGTGGGLNLDPLLLEALAKIPVKGEEWPASRRLRWFKLFAMNVSEVYDDDANVVDLKIEIQPAQKQNGGT